MTFLRWIGRAGWALVAVLGLLLLVVVGRAWIEADIAAPFTLAGPATLATPARLQHLRDDPARCRRLLDRAGVAYRALPPRGDRQCGFDDGVDWGAGGARAARYAPAAPPMGCALAAALAMWEWQVVQPAAAELLDTTVVGITHLGTYNCRRIRGRPGGSWSEHARAQAIDVAGFRLADGGVVTVARDWGAPGRHAAFLHRVRDGACRLFGTTLSPDYNAAHHDHLHLDEAARGGWRACR